MKIIESETIVDEIFDFKKKFCPDYNIVDTILEFCIKNDYDIQEVGDILSENALFVEILEKHLVNEKYFKSNNKVDLKFEEEEWE